MSVQVVWRFTLTMVVRVLLTADDDGMLNRTLPNVRISGGMLPSYT